MIDIAAKFCGLLHYNLKNMELAAKSGRGHSNFELEVERINYFFLLADLAGCGNTLLSAIRSPI